MTILQLLKEEERKEIHNLIIYSADYLWDRPKPQFEKEYRITIGKLRILKEQIQELERERLLKILVKEGK